ncbi:hypothetical protein SBOR_0168 [Sclerotinia borealis F-4128]|uniref:Uncharacterized protein n=1 Tax=Sclerotinia borealis (strain F-4128) TaxID=1432307 RepID=W9CU57_SCLBF|nr:hypothetical protein SBOR_0168 [Sclerotinia borealis F-4128]
MCDSGSSEKRARKGSLGLQGTGEMLEHLTMFSEEAESKKKRALKEDKDDVPLKRRILGTGSRKEKSRDEEYQEKDKKEHDERAGEEKKGEKAEGMEKRGKSEKSMGADANRNGGQDCNEVCQDDNKEGGKEENVRITRPEDPWCNICEENIENTAIIDHGHNNQYFERIDVAGQRLKESAALTQLDIPAIKVLTLAPQLKRETARRMDIRCLVVLE